MKGMKSHICLTFMVTLVSMSLHKYPPLTLVGCHGEVLEAKGG